MQQDFRSVPPLYSSRFRTTRFGLRQKRLRAGVLFGTIIGLALSPLLRAAPVLIAVETQTATPLAGGFSGFNVPQPRTGVEYFDPKYVAAVTPLKPGWVRFPGGTVSMAFDWQAGHMNTDWINSLIDADPPLVAAQTANILT